MFSRAILLLAMSPVVWGAGVTIELDTDILIGTIEYTPPEEVPSLPDVHDLSSSADSIIIDTSWDIIDESNTGLDSLKYLNFSHPNSRLGVLFESVVSTESSFHGLYFDNELNAISVNPDGSQTIFAYPVVDAEISGYGIRNGVPYLVDKDSDTILEWGVDYWNDIKVSQNLPSGHFLSVKPYSKGYLIATAEKVDEDLEEEIEPSVPTELWDAGDATFQIPIIGQVDQARYINTPDGMLQIFSEDLSSYTARWLENDEPNFKININSIDFPYIYSAYTSTGTFIIFFNEVSSITFWMPSGSSIGEQVHYPQNLKSFHNCFSASNKAFCVMNTEDLGYTLYEMVDGEFVLDTQLNEAISGKTVNGIYAVGNSRYISASYHGVTGSRSYLYLANGEKVEEIFDIGISGYQDMFLIIPSLIEGAFYWVGRNVGSTKIYKAEVSGDFTLKRNLDSIVPVENTIQEPSSSGSGSMPVYLLAMLLTLLISGARKRQFSNA